MEHQTTLRSASLQPPTHNPNLTGQSGIYLHNQLVAFRNRTRRHPGMKTIARDLSIREIEQIVPYYSILPPP
jgi:cytochrome c553